MEAEEITDIIAGILASIGLITWVVGVLYWMYSVIMFDRQIKQDLKMLKDELAKIEKEE